jgi:hypothetical protein
LVLVRAQLEWLDVDFGISLAVSGERHGTIKSDLAELGFKSEGNRLVRKSGHLNLYLDFLTEGPPLLTGARIVDDVIANVIPGVNRALACRRIVAVKGRKPKARWCSFPGCARSWSD